MGKAEDHDAQRHANLRRCKAGAVGGFHGVDQVSDECVEIRRIKALQRLSDVQQPGVAHAQDVFDHGARLLIVQRVLGFNSAAFARCLFALGVFDGFKHRIQISRVLVQLEGAGQGRVGVQLAGLEQRPHFVGVARVEQVRCSAAEGGAQVVQVALQQAERLMGWRWH